jgi:hypothetical protein
MDREPGQDQSSLAAPERPARKPWARFRLSLARLMVIVLSAGIVCGLVLRASDRQRREVPMWGEIYRQRETTSSILHLPDPIVRQHAPVQTFQWSDQWARNNADSPLEWIDGKRIWYVERGERHNLVNLAIAGDAQDLVLTPIVIEDRGGELNAHFIDRLTEAYRANHWAYRVVPAASDDGAQAAPH